MTPDPTYNKKLFEEIITTFQDIPRPKFHLRYDPCEDEAEERLSELMNKTWLDIARDPKYLSMYHSTDDFTYMTDECFLYFFPGYLLCILEHKPVFVEPLAGHILMFLAPTEQSADEVKQRARFLLENLTDSQKAAVAHWLQLQLERERHPLIYETDPFEAKYQTACKEWRKWA